MKLLCLAVLTTALLANPILPNDWQQYFEFAEVQVPNAIHHLDELTDITSDESLEAMRLFIMKDSFTSPTHLIGIDEFNQFNSIDNEVPKDEFLVLQDSYNDKEIEIPNLQIWPIEELENGVTVKSTGKKQIVKLYKTQQFIIIDYLYSGLTGKRKQETLVIDETDHIKLISAKNETVKQLHFVVNKNFVGITLGIKKILINDEAVDRITELKEEY